MNYQYRAFGVPGLGFKRGLADDLVIAPYATAMALMVAPEKACANLQVMATSGFQGQYGFYEAIDYTPSRLARGQRQAIVCTRRARSHKEHPPWMLHLLAVRGAAVGEATYETDRMKFLGRGGSVAAPDSLNRAAKLTNSEGSVLDPIVAIRRVVTLAPDEVVTVDLVTVPQRHRRSD